MIGTSLPHGRLRRGKQGDIAEHCDFLGGINVASPALRRAGQGGAGPACGGLPSRHQNQKEKQKESASVPGKGGGRHGRPLGPLGLRADWQEREAQPTILNGGWGQGTHRQLELFIGRLGHLGRRADGHESHAQRAQLRRQQRAHRRAAGRRLLRTCQLLLQLRHRRTEVLGARDGHGRGTLGAAAHLQRARACGKNVVKGGRREVGNGSAHATVTGAVPLAPLPTCSAHGPSKKGLWRWGEERVVWRWVVLGRVVWGRVVW
eukprot:357161-Chlamydomonas_euryale.AAC.1